QCCGLSPSWCRRSRRPRARACGRRWALPRVWTRIVCPPQPGGAGLCRGRRSPRASRCSHASTAEFRMLVDTHCHLDMLEDLNGALDPMRAAGVAHAVTIGVDRASSEWSVRAARTHDQIWATVGLHPHDAKDQSDQLLSYIEQLASTEQRVVGVGEAGLDYHYDNSPRERQREVYAKQVEMARRVGKALVIHSRDAWDDTFSILASAGAPPRVVFHCFSGSPVEARRALDIGAS